VFFFGLWHEPNLEDDKPKWRRRRINIKRIGMIKPKDEGWVIHPPVKRGFFEGYNWFQIACTLVGLAALVGSCALLAGFGR